MFEPDGMKTTFMIEQANYQYKVMLFGLKNVGVTYQRIMNKIFQEEIWEVMEAYMDNMVVKSGQDKLNA